MKSLGTTAIGIVIGSMALASCSGSGTPIPVTYASSQSAAAPSHFVCNASGSNVSVSGFVTGLSTRSTPAGISVAVYDSQGDSIGQNSAIVTGLTFGHSEPVSLTVSTEGHPSSCSINTNVAVAILRKH
jgi:hypothetical protein